MYLTDNFLRFVLSSASCTGSICLKDLSSCGFFFFQSLKKCWNFWKYFWVCIYSKRGVSCFGSFSFTHKQWSSVPLLFIHSVLHNLITRQLVESSWLKWTSSACTSLISTTEVSSSKALNSYWWLWSECTASWCTCLWSGEFWKNSLTVTPLSK